MSAKCCFEMRKQSYNRHLSIHPGSIPTHIWSTGTSSAVHFRHYSFTTENHKRWIPDRVPWDRGDGTPAQVSRNIVEGQLNSWLPLLPGQCVGNSFVPVLVPSDRREFHLRDFPACFCPPDSAAAFSYFVLTLRGLLS